MFLGGFGLWGKLLRTAAEPLLMIPSGPEFFIQNKSAGWPDDRQSGNNRPKPNSPMVPDDLMAEAPATADQSSPLMHCSRQTDDRALTNSRSKPV